MPKEFDWSPTSILMKHRFQQLGLLDFHGRPKPWTPEQILELCRLLRVTPADLGCMFGSTAREMHTYVTGKRKPPVPVCLHMLIIRSWFVERRIKNPTQPHAKDTALDLIYG